MLVKDEVEEVAGVKSVSVDFKKGFALVTFDNYEEKAEEEICKRIESLGDYKMTKVEGMSENRKGIFSKLFN